MQPDLTPDNVAKSDPSVHQQPGRFGDHLQRAIREILAVLFWTYAIVKLFIFDVDILFFQKFLPGYAWIVTYRFIILLGIIGTIWLFTRNREVFGWSLYIACYPLILLFWKLPFFVLRQRSWILAIAVLDVIVSFFKSIKHSFISATFFLISVAVVFGSTNEWLLWMSVAILLILNIDIYFYRLVLIFKPSSLYQAYTSVVAFGRKGLANLQEILSQAAAAQAQQPAPEVRTLALDEDGKRRPVESLDKTQRDQWIADLQMRVFVNRIYLFGATKLKEYQGSGFNVVFSILTIMFLFIFTTFSFAAINLGLYKINKDLFVVSATPSFFTLFYYSFCNAINSGIQDIAPIAAISQAARMMQSFSSLFLLGILVSLQIPALTQKHIKELDEIIAGFETSGEDIESYIREEYKINSIQDAMAELAKLEASLAKFLYSMSEAIR